LNKHYNQEKELFKSSIELLRDWLHEIKREARPS